MKKTIRKAIMHRFNPLFTMASYLIQTLELLVFLSKLSYAIAKVKNLILGEAVSIKDRLEKIGSTVSY